jgi:hypothetical protein
MRPRTFLRFFLPSWAMLRLSVYLVFAFSLCSVLAARVVYGKATEAALAFGHELIGLEDLTSDDEIVEVNGERLHRATAASTDSVAAVLDRVEDYCKKSPGVLGQGLQEALQQHPDLLAKRVPAGALRSAVIRNEAGERGMVACFTDDRVSGLAGLKGALRRFVETSNLGEFGHFRYTYAERKGEKTYVSTMWADTGLNLKTMFPATGDAAGSDSALLPRPPSARRTLSAGAEGMPYALRMYVSSDSTESLGRFYADWLKKRGWKLIGQKPSHGSSGYMREDGYQVFLTIIEQRGQAYVALTESGNGRTPSVASVVVKE